MRDDRALLADILEAVDEVAGCLPARESAFHTDVYLRSHVLRQIQIIGEACWRVSDRVKEAHPEVPWKQIAATRHLIVHDYFRVNWSRVFETALDHVPPLRPKIQSILESLPPGSGKVAGP